MQSRYDVVVAGAGPAGLRAALTAQAAGLSVLVLSEQRHLGGQIYHSLERASEEKKKLLGTEYLTGQELIQQFRAAGVPCIFQAGVVAIEPGRSVCYAQDDALVEIAAPQLILATGAMERPVAVHGWTTPGVMGAAAADILLKESDMLPAGKVVFAGSGPLLLSTVCHMLDCGVPVTALLDTSRKSQYIAALPHGMGALANPGLLYKGLLLLAKIRKAGVPVYRGIQNIRATGAKRLEAVEYTHKASVKQTAADLLLVHEGVIPNTQLSRLAGCKHQWYAPQRYFKAVTDKWGHSSVAGVWLAGDCAGIYGAQAAETAGALAGLDVAFHCGALGRHEQEERGRALLRTWKKQTAIRPFLDTLYAPASNILLPSDPATLVCRCEEVRLETVLHAMEQGATLPTTIKNTTRCGMGRCQGRMCGPVLGEVLAHRQSSMTMDAIGLPSVRPMVRPVSMAQLGSLRLLEATATQGKKQ